MVWCRILVTTTKVEKSNGVVLVEFYTPWCGHCKALTPVWEKAASVLKGVVSVAAIDADAHQSIAQEYGIKGFPTIKVFVPGKPPVDYQGAREAKPIAKFALSQVEKSKGVVLVEFYALWCGHYKDLTSAWEKAASVLKGEVTVAAIDADAHQSIAQIKKLDGLRRRW